MPFPPGLSAALAGGGVVAAASPRAARFLRRLYAEEQRKKALAAWRSPAIFHWEGWLDSLWQQRLRSGEESRIVLSTVQEHQLWARLIRPEIETRALISIDGVAELAQQAYSLLSSYDCLEALRSEWSGSDARSFREWARAFEAECHDKGWLSRSRLSLALAQSIAARPAASLPLFAQLEPALRLPPVLILAGFDRILPAQRRLLAALEKAGTRIELDRSLQTPAELQPVEELVAANDAEDELTLCAWWARREMELAATENRQARIAVIVPQLTRQRAAIERVFRQVLAPASLPVDAPERSLPFEFSLGLPLDQAPMARAALLLLQWMTEPLSRDDLGWLVLSGFLWAAEEDWLPVAIFDADLRRSGVLPPEYPLETYLRQRGWNASPALASLRDRLYTARREWRAAGEEARSFADWAEAARRILSAAGWPGPHRMNSLDFQRKTKWEQLLDSVSTLSFDGRSADYQQFRRILQRQAEQTIFSPESRDAPIQILGPFEAAGLEFDAIWFLGASEDGWPAPGHPHPFLPAALQRERGMPHAERSADWELARQVTARIQHSASRTIFSYPLQEKDGQVRPSTILGLRATTVSSARMRETLALPRLAEMRSPLTVLEEEHTSPIPWPAEREAGGYAVLKSQAACPFQAFAGFRLQARELDRADWGLDPRDRGTLLHRALEGIWSEFADRDALIAAAGENRLRKIVEKHVNEALARYGGGQTTPAGQELERWSEAYLEGERQRVIRLLEEWLAYEAERPPFSVEQRETPIAANVGGLKLKLRADRIDKIDDGRLLIDYKSGKASPNAWEGQRPDEPQLPLYAAFGNVPELRGVLLAQLQSREFKFMGRVEEAERAGFNRLRRSDVAPFSQELRQRWQQVLLTLAARFLQGAAQVDPKQRKTCAFCPLPGLCRVAELDRDWATEPEESNGSDGAGSSDQTDQNNQSNGNDNGDQAD
jgi:probable DNA repair protein